MPLKNVRCQKSALAFEKVRSHHFLIGALLFFFQDLQGAGTWSTCRELGAGSWELPAAGTELQGAASRETG